MWVYCAGGYRASIAASILAAQTSRVVAVDDSFGEQAKLVGLPLVAVAESVRRSVTNRVSALIT